VLNVPWTTSRHRCQRRFKNLTNIHLLLEDGGRLEHDGATGRDRRFLTGMAVR
jgi:hypothetical protein